MAVYFRGLDAEETRTLTLAMRDSGEQLHFPPDPHEGPAHQDRRPPQHLHADHRRKGKVARLPYELREKINLMLQDGIPYADVIKKLGERLRSDGLLRNPPIVAESDQHYIVLDGATRTGALKYLGIRDTIVQIVDYAARNICLDSWHHLIIKTPPSDFRQDLELFRDMIALMRS